MMLPNLNRKALEKRIAELEADIGMAVNVDDKYPTISSANHLQSCIEKEKDLQAQLEWLDELNKHILEVKDGNK